ncbi:MAG: AAA-associated domain-containing protein [Chloroflexi bacterium]|nr:AAA-associated domain-containing protein [Chloroflexota bacterium]
MTTFNQQNNQQAPATQTAEILLEAQHISKSYTDDKSSSQGGRTHLVLDDIQMQIMAGEFVAILGPSGSGKSTLLRILAGLLNPSEGQVLFKGKPQYGPNPHLAIVFQSFALFPWLTVFQNVELGLQAQELTQVQRYRRTLAAIDTIGLDGFEDAYPKELSGGMRQRVGFARALVVEPELLFMDEPFSALDVLTAANLRKELMGLWQAHTIPTKGIVMVTHNIDEAVSMADRIFVLGANPGVIRVELPGLPLAQRSISDQAHTALVDLIYRIMTSPHEDVETLLPTVAPKGKTSPLKPAQATVYKPLPPASIGDITGLIELVHTQGDRVDIYQIGRQLQLEADELLPLVEAARLLRFARTEEGDLVLTEQGRHFADAGVLEEKNIFREQALAAVPMLSQIVQALERTPGHTLPEEYFVNTLESYVDEEQAVKELDTIVNWGRYAELFAYHDDRGIFRLEEPEPADKR